MPRAHVPASRPHRRQSPPTPAPSACPGACARRRGARPGGVRAPLSTGECVGAVAAFLIILPRALVPASRPHRRQSPPAAPLRQPPQPAPARARGAAGRGQAGSAHLFPSGHVWVPWPLRLFSRNSPSYLPATGVSPPPQPLCARRAVPAIGICAGALPVRLPPAVLLALIGSHLLLSLRFPKGQTQRTIFF